jgi:hypothetical protein
MASRRGKASGGRNPSTGLYERGELLERIAAHLANCPAPVPGGLLFLEIESSSSLRERLGLSSDPSLDDVFLDAAGRTREHVEGDVQEVKA